MTNELDYNNEAVQKILDNPNYTEEEKKKEFEKYKSNLKKARRKAITSKLNECARAIPVITEDIYIDFLKRYDDDNLTKPFEVIELEIKQFEKEMTEKYNNYLQSKSTNNEDVKEEKIEEPEEDDEIIPDVTPDLELQEDIEDEFDDTMFKDPEELQAGDVTPSLFIKDEVSVLNEEPELLAKPLFENSDEEIKEVMPEELPDSLDEKGNASAIILSIIAIIVGVVIMYSIIRLK